MTYDPLDSSVTEHPYPHYAELREKTPVKWIASMQAFAVAKYGDVLTVLQNSDTYSSSQFWPALLGEYDPVPEVAPMISLDPPGHVRIRKLANAAFVPKKIASFPPKIRGIANDLVDDIIARNGKAGSFDFVWEFSALFPVTVVADVLGVDVKRRSEFKHWVDDVLSAGNRAAYGPERLTQIAKSSMELRQYFDDLYEQRKLDPKDDLVSAFTHAEVEGQRLTKAEVMNLAILLLIGGVETTTNLLGITLVHLRSRPEVMQRVRDNNALIPNLIEEVLRYDTPVQMLFRHTLKPAVLNGVEIPQGSLVLPLLGSANRDADQFADPDTFNIDRQPGQTMSFGNGAHFCLGTFLSKMEAKIAVEVLLDRFEQLQAVDGKVKWMDSYFARGPKTLPVRFKVREPELAHG
ncbi:MAG: cytochrome p450 [Hydrocarboniphaga sp.]|uniref:cytochrome P450 n=1 Tax=Hydrocarboniphaga sp. TaxID=2033016 RepID=UPI00261000FE|nr:cytochrome P450 [Hydrocarboniphaga sp.]MDB5971662.1 cytochrome p450 [Hydrocarboniphaga sp.]